MEKFSDVYRRYLSIAHTVGIDEYNYAICLLHL